MEETIKKTMPNMQKNTVLKLQELVTLLNAKVVTGAQYFDPDYLIKTGFASDLMSDVLTLNTEHMLLLTGLNNIQTVRTAEMSDIRVIVIARNKKISEQMIELATENNIILLECNYSLYKATGILYSAGLPPVY